MKKYESQLWCIVHAIGCRARKMMVLNVTEDV